MKYLSLFSFLIFSFCTSIKDVKNYENDRIQAFKTNPGYWQYKGKPVFLLGGNLTDNTFQLNQAEMKAYLEELQSLGGNYIRNVMSDRKEGNLRAFEIGDNGKYDLNKWNNEYWDNLKFMLEHTSRLNIIVHLTLWDRFDHYDQIHDDDPYTHYSWINNPWNPAQNVNYTFEETNLETTYPFRASSMKNPFLKTPPSMENNQKVLVFQQKFINRIMDICLAYDHVIFNMGNEHNVDLKEWDEYWCEYIIEYASSFGKKIETTAMFDKSNNFGPVVERPDIYSFIEGSKVGSMWTPQGEEQYNVAYRLVKSTIEKKRRPVNAVKVRTQRIVHNPQERLWRPLMAGFAALSHHRNHFPEMTPDGWPSGGLGFTELAKSNIKAMRIFTDVIIPWECEPRQDLLLNRIEDETYLLANEGKSYGLYFLKGSGSVELDIINFPGKYKVQWIDIGLGEVVMVNELNVEDVLKLTVPYDNKYGWACCLTK